MALFKVLKYFERLNFINAITKENKYPPNDKPQHLISVIHFSQNFEGDIHSIVRNTGSKRSNFL